VAESVVTLRVDASGATRALQGVQNRTNALQRSFGGLKAAIGGVGISLLARQAVRTSINFDKLNLRLGLLTKATGDFSAAQKIATDGQKLFGLSATEALEGVTNITARLKPLGVSLEDIRTTFIGFNTAAKLGGANAQEASNAFRQLAQALGSGRLAGDEFRSVSEQIPLILKPLADELDVDVGKLKELAAQGKLTSDVVIRALRKLGTQGGEDLKAILENDPTQVFKNLSNEAENLSRAVGEQLTPAILPVIKALTELTKSAVEFVNSPIAKTAAIFAAIAFAAKGVAVLLPILTAGLIKVAAAGGALTIVLNAFPFVAVATAIGGVVTALIKVTSEQKKFTEALKEGDKAALKSELNRLFITRQKLLQRLGTAQENNNKRAEASLKRQLAELNKNYDLVQKRLLTEIDKTNEIEKQNKKLQEQEELQKKNQEAAAKLKEKMTAVGEEIETSIKGNLRDAITGAQSFGQAMTNVLNRIRDKIIDAQIDKILGNFGENFGASASGGKRKGLGGFLGGILGGLFRANGGPVKAGQPYIVGERQPELFVPRTSGTILPSTNIGGGDNTTNMVTVNVDASGSSVAGSSTDAQALGAAIGAAVQAQLIKEKRPGGLLTR
jgi:tape measure domain-containing protein|tara:strand:+ start:4817 stop:6661 length:1845 start_codon:yes stop_codon:yes gene_type:complete